MVAGTITTTTTSGCILPSRPHGMYTTHHAIGGRGGCSQEKGAFVGVIGVCGFVVVGFVVVVVVVIVGGSSSCDAAIDSITT